MTLGVPEPMLAAEGKEGRGERKDKGKQDERGMSEGGRGGIVEGRGCWCWCCCVGVLLMLVLLLVSLP